MLQTQWVAMALAGGAVVTLLLIMSYLALWQPRRGKTPPHQTPRHSAWIEWFADIPWILIFLFVAGLLFIIVYTVDKMVHPPNW